MYIFIYIYAVMLFGSSFFSLQICVCLCVCVCIFYGLATKTVIEVYWFKFQCDFQSFWLRIKRWKNLQTQLKSDPTYWNKYHSFSKRNETMWKHVSFISHGPMQTINHIKYNVKAVNAWNFRHCRCHHHHHNTHQRASECAHPFINTMYKKKLLDIS